MSSKNKKKSLSKIIKWLVVIALALLIIVPLSVNKVRHDYSLASKLPVSQTTKTRAFWFSLDSKKLKQLKEENKIDHFSLSDSNGVSLIDGEYRYTFIFNKNSSNAELPNIDIRLLKNPDISGIAVMFATNGNSAGEPYNPNNLSDSQVDELTKRGMELYNQFIKDYENL